MYNFEKSENQHKKRVKTGQRANGGRLQVYGLRGGLEPAAEGLRGQIGGWRI